MFLSDDYPEKVKKLVFLLKSVTFDPYHENKSGRIWKWNLKSTQRGSHAFQTNSRQHLRVTNFMVLWRVAHRIPSLLQFMTSSRAYIMNRARNNHLKDFLVVQKLLNYIFTRWHDNKFRLIWKKNKKRCALWQSRWFG